MSGLKHWRYTLQAGKLMVLPKQSNADTSQPICPKVALNHRRVRPFVLESYAVAQSQKSKVVDLSVSKASEKISIDSGN